MTECEYLCHQAIAPGRCDVPAHWYGMQLGVGLGDDLGHPLVLNSGITLQSQGGEQDLIRKLACHRRVGDDVDLALDPGIDKEVRAGEFADGLNDRIDVGVLEVERHRVVGREQWQGQKGGKQDETTQAGDKQHGCLGSIR
jgi:hypothetical protein